MRKYFQGVSKGLLVGVAVAAVLVMGAVGGILATGGKQATKTALVAPADATASTTTTTPATSATPTPGGSPTTTVAAPETTLPPNADPVVAANSAAASANSAQQSATAAAGSAQTAQSAATSITDTPTTTTTSTTIPTTDAPSYCAGSLAADQAAPQWPTPTYGALCTDSVGTFVRSNGLDCYHPTGSTPGYEICPPTGVYRLS